MVALRRWEVIAPKTPASDWAYKGNGPGRRDRRQEYLAALQKALGEGVVLTGPQADRFIDDDDDFDAFLSALIARAAQLGATDPVPRGMRWLAMREGWIHLPTPGSLTKLATANA